LSEYLWATQLVTAAVAAAALGLALALARRVRLLQDRLDQGVLVEADLPVPGEPVPDFDATTVDGVRLGAQDLAGPDVLLLFLTASCESCREEVDRLRAEPPAAAEARPIAVVMGRPEERAELVRDLLPLARVVEQTDYAGLAARFGVRGFPAMLVVGDGVVRRAGHLLSEVRVGTPT
jgi:hypothetical protein